jgi:AcrR family transcriptional regulator
VLDRIHEAPGAALHAHLVEVAERLLGERAVSAITTREVARTAGVSDGVLYNYFSDKHELILAALMKRFERIAAEYAASLPEAGSATVEANLAALCRAQVTFQSQLLPLMVGLLSEPALLGRFIDVVHGHQFGPPYGVMYIVEYIRNEQRLGRVDAAVDPEGVAMLLMGAGMLTAFADQVAPAFGQTVAQVPIDDRVRTIVGSLIRGIGDGDVRGA